MGLVRRYAYADMAPTLDLNGCCAWAVKPLWGALVSGHDQTTCPFCTYDGVLAGEALRTARFVHEELLQLDDAIDVIKRRITPIAKTREQTLRNLRDALGLENESRGDAVDLWSAS